MTPCAANSVERKIIQVLRRPAADGAPSRGLFRWILRLASSWAWGLRRMSLMLVYGVESVDRDWRLLAWVMVYVLCSPLRFWEGPTSEMGLGWMLVGGLLIGLVRLFVVRCYCYARDGKIKMVCRVGFFEAWGEMSDER